MKKSSFALKLFVFISLSAFLVIGMVIGIQAVKIREIAKKEALDRAEETVNRYANYVDAKLDRSMDVVRTLAQTFEALKKSGNVSRDAYNEVLKNILEKNTDVFGVWTCWEPDLLDGRDVEYAGKPGYDKTGRFIPYWNRGLGKVVMDCLVDYDKPGDGDYYLLAKNLREETIIEPYSYKVGGKDVLMTSVAVPIVVEGRVVGVTGIDVVLADLQSLSESVHPFGSGVTAIFSNTGLIAAHFDATRVGKQMRETERDMVGDHIEPFAQAIKDGKPHIFYFYASLLKSEMFIQSVPFTVGKTKTPWSFAIGVPMKEILASSNSAMKWAMGTGFVGLLLMVGVVVLVTRSVSLPLMRMSEALNDMSQQLASASDQVSGASHSLAEGSSEQAASLEETSSSLEEMVSMTKRNTESAENAQKLANEARVAADKGAEEMSAMSQSMSEIQGASNEISKIIKTIDEISFQTNILALNAAVEAARAGEAGAGFAVVADEVRNLAQRSALASKETASKIEASIQKSVRGMDISKRVAESLLLIQTRVNEVDALVAKIADASQEQRQGVDQINLAVGQIDKVTQSNAANAEETASASEELSAQAIALMETVKELTTLVQGVKDESGQRFQQEATNPDFRSTHSNANAESRRALKINSKTHALPQRSS